ncbi:hypothetical protein [Nitrobacter sp.]|uniref:hypothetical protein n=1 Tax=Nitrobacter sp. TaxID=29420 RepID=UPI0029CAB327|nr:hypothetical protein [Nitrobacter sp.]
MSILTDGSLAARLTDALVAADLPYSIKVQHLESDDDPFNPTTTWVDHACTGWLDTFDARDIDDTLILQTDRKAFVVASSIDITPSATDRLVVSGTTYTIVHVQLDPASTCWVVQARK